MKTEAHTALKINVSTCTKKDNPWSAMYQDSE